MGTKEKKLSDPQEKFVEGVVKHGTKKKPPVRTVPKHKIDLFVEGVVQGKGGGRAVIDAGWKQTPAAAYVTATRLLRNAKVAEAVERRRAEARRKAHFHTDEIIGMLAEISTASLTDVLEPDGTFDPVKCAERGTDHLIKKVRTTEQHRKDGSKHVTHEYEMYSRLEAIDQLRDTFGMKQEARPNNFEEIERAIKVLIQKAREKGYELTL